MSNGLVGCDSIKRLNCCPNDVRCTVVYSMQNRIHDVWQVGIEFPDYTDDILANWDYGSWIICSNCIYSRGITHTQIYTMYTHAISMSLTTTVVKMIINHMLKLLSNALNQACECHIDTGKLTWCSMRLTDGCRLIMTCLEILGIMFMKALYLDFWSNRCFRIWWTNILFI